jgi:hypothetical protein
MLVFADNDDEDEPSTFQLGDLHACTIQEKNIQGRTIIGIDGFCRCYIVTWSYGKGSQIRSTASSNWISFIAWDIDHIS